MKLPKPSRSIFLLAALCLATSCGKSKSDEAVVDHHPTHIDHQECAACGMVVREQPSPRAQLIHRDGTHLHFCSVSDMLTYLDAPSSHGDAVSLYVESLDNVSDPIVNQTEELPWIPAKESSYVIGVKKQRIMGRPILSYSTKEFADKAAKATSGSVVDWKGLRSSQPR